MKPAFVEFVAVWASAVCAGIIESSRGGAIVTPMPGRNVRRGMCFLGMNIVLHLFRPGLERCALHDAHHERRETVVVAFRFARNLSDDRHIVVVEPAAEA